MNGAPIPTMKVENAPSPQIKVDPADVHTDEEDVYEDEGDLDFTNGDQQHWLSRVPKSLWEVFAAMPDDGEIEIGTVRVEGDMADPKRVSLKLGALPIFRGHPKEYNMLPSRRETLQSKQSRTAFVFSEKDMPGTKRKAAGPLGEEGGNFHNRSYLHEKNKRGFKRSEDKKAGKPFEAYVRKAVPKQTAIAGIVAREFECAPVENAEYLALEKLKVELMLKPKEVEETSFDKLKDAKYMAPGSVGLYGKSVSAKEQKKKEAAKDNRAARIPKNELIDKILDCFQWYQYWGLREIKHRVNQPEVYVREVLSEVATLWKSGDLNGKWELKPEFKEKHIEGAAAGTAPDQMQATEQIIEQADEEDDEKELFEDV